mmetsp:Transcript_24637/g.56876  ORF Transcript_24637/g.56876 Transcript_24637/m.56876 type:complete len:249 (+) Transcript_24637:665-1411(+)
MSTFFSPYFWWMGHKAMAPTAVVQLGFAIKVAPSAASMLISGMTRGMSFSYLKADELSTTTVFFGPPATFGEYSCEKPPDTAISKMSHSWPASTVNGSTVISPNFFEVTTVPAALFAKSRTALHGKSRSSKHRNISTPTAPEQPAIPTVSSLPAAIVVRPHRTTAQLLEGCAARLPRVAALPAARQAPPRTTDSDRSDECCDKDGLLVSPTETAGALDATGAAAGRSCGATRLAVLSCILPRLPPKSL